MKNSSIHPAKGLAPMLRSGRAKKTARSRPPMPMDMSWIRRYFRQFCKIEGPLLMGVESELLGVSDETCEAIPYEGPRGIEGVFRALIERFAWSGVLESGRVIALKRGGAEIHLEPGAQLEFCSVPHASLKDLETELEGHYAELREVSRDLGLSWLALGMHPFSDLEDIPWVPKGRYHVLKRYLGEKGRLAHRMMKQTATLQANLDYRDEEGAMKGLRAALAISPVLTGLFANSPLAKGRFGGSWSLRAEAWRETDWERCGLIEEVLVDEPSLEDYLRYLAKIPMIFRQRNDQWEDAGGMSFSQFLNEGRGDLSGTEADWELFLTSVFPEARLNPFIEIRSADRNSPILSLALLAFLKGLLMDEESREAAWALVRDWTFEERQQFLADAARLALKARARGRALRDWARELLDCARAGLKRQGEKRLSGEDESLYLEPLEALLEEGLCPAEKLLRCWEGPWNRDPRKLVEASRI